MGTPQKAGDGLKMIDDDSTSRSVTAERVVAHTNSVELPLLTKGNYHEWALVMQVSLEAMELWDAVEAVCKERAKDRWALAAILRTVPSEMKVGLAVKKTAKEAWDAVKSMRVGNDRVKAANVQRLMKEFENVAFRDGESIDDFAMRINRLVSSIRELGEKVEDSRVVKKILRVIPKKWKHVAVSIEMLLDLNIMSIEELVGRLRVAEDADNDEVKEAAEEVAGRLYLTEEQWEARRRQRNKERARGGDARRGNSGGGDGRRGSGNKGGGDSDERSDADDDASSMISGWSRHRGRCFECGERGHIAGHCREKKKKALMADAIEEPTLL
ncbi:hypothetical protein GUJ93_ZPchr0001g29702 [Zizania palustris]|uniref:CCHC-type domain-containing protein n=1 Tax=Zizania palustris TaxID=103762 RepID=A0A8J5S9Q6_ZIZPA|nr:hypothetical protein GUJ93_ZPchr0001g29702 [Zizania palustris]